jgi:hypothetical protein
MGNKSFHESQSLYTEEKLKRTAAKNILKMEEVKYLFVEKAYVCFITYSE